MKIRKLLMMICAVTLCLNMSIPALAATNADLDMDAGGSVTITMKHNNAAVTGARWTAYRVGEVQNEDWNLSWDPAEGFEAVSFDDISSAALPGELLNILNDMAEAEKPRSWVSQEVSPGVYLCGGDDEMPLGLYLMVLTRNAPGYQTAEAFLVTIPLNDGELWVYDVEAGPKVESKPVPPSDPDTPDDPDQPDVPDEPDTPDDPDTPDEPDVPDQPDSPDEPDESDEPTVPDDPGPTDPPLIQTGQLNWPVPVLAGLGLVLLLLGLALLRGRRRSR